MPQQPYDLACLLFHRPRLHLLQEPDKLVDIVLDQNGHDTIPTPQMVSRSSVRVDVSGTVSSGMLRSKMSDESPAIAASRNSSLSPASSPCGGVFGSRLPPRAFCLLRSPASFRALMISALALP